MSDVDARGVRSTGLAGPPRSPLNKPHFSKIDLAKLQFSGLLLDR